MPLQNQSPDADHQTLFFLFLSMLHMGYLQQMRPQAEEQHGKCAAPTAQELFPHLPLDSKMKN